MKGFSRSVSFIIPALLSSPGMKLLSVKEVADVLQVSKRRVHQLIEEGRLPATKVGIQFVVKAVDVKKLKINPPGRPKNPKTD